MASREKIQIASEFNTEMGKEEKPQMEAFLRVSLFLGGGSGLYSIFNTATSELMSLTKYGILLLKVLTNPTMSILLLK